MLVLPAKRPIFTALDWADLPPGATRPSTNVGKSVDNSGDRIRTMVRLHDTGVPVPNYDGRGPLRLIFHLQNLRAAAKKSLSAWDPGRRQPHTGLAQRQTAMAKVLATGLSPTIILHSQANFQARIIQKSSTTAIRTRTPPPAREMDPFVDLSLT